MNVTERLNLNVLSSEDYETRLQLELFEPRWHGFARWRLERHWKSEPDALAAITQILDEGWIRRGRSDPYLRIGGFSPYPTGVDE